VTKLKVGAKLLEGSKVKIKKIVLTLPKLGKTSL